MTNIAIIPRHRNSLYRFKMKNGGRLTVEGVRKALLSASGLMKELMGVANNAAWLVCLDAHDELKKLPNWKRQVKGGSTAEKDFQRVFKEYDAYERKLISNDNGFFDIKGFPEKVRKMYGDITSQDYYDFWTEIGGSSYKRTRPFICSLQNKYRLALIHAGIDDNTAKIIAWGKCASACLDSAIIIYEMSIDMIDQEFGIPSDILDLDFQGFNLKNVAKLWKGAMRTASPECDAAEISDLDRKNIENGLQQITEKWTEGSGIYDDLEKAIRDCGEDVLSSKKSIINAIKDVRKLREVHENS